MLEKAYCKEEPEITMKKAELECMIAEAEERGYRRGAKQNEKLKEILRAVSAMIKIVSDE